MDYFCHLTSLLSFSYFIPEDGDEELHPNVFLAPKSRDPTPTLQAVQDAFPLPGHYHFRFKSPLTPGGDRDKGAMAVGMDVVQPQQPVPTWRNSIVAKVTRISMEEEDDDDDDEDFRRPHATPAAVPQRAAPSSTASTGSGDHLDMLFDSNSGPSPASGGGGGDLFDSHPPSAPASGGSLLDFGASPPASGGGGAHSDFLGMTAPTHQQHQQQPRGPSPLPPQQQQYPPQQQQPPQQRQTMNSYSKQAQPFGDLGAWS